MSRTRAHSAPYPWLERRCPRDPLGQSVPDQKEAAIAEPGCPTADGRWRGSRGRRREHSPRSGRAGTSRGPADRGPPPGRSPVHLENGERPAEPLPRFRTALCEVGSPLRTPPAPPARRGSSRENGRPRHGSIELWSEDRGAGPPLHHDILRHRGRDGRMLSATEPDLAIGSVRAEAPCRVRRPLGVRSSV